MSAIAMIAYGTLPAVRITAADGAQAIVTLYGAHLISWKDAGGTERLFCSAKSALDGSRAIRGGVPVIFPQFAERGNGMRHGFARVSTWRLHASGTDDNAAFAEFALTEADLAPGAVWPHGFTLSLRVAVKRHDLTLTLGVRNTGADAFTFASALHTYFLVDDLAKVRIDGVQEGELRIADKFDQIFVSLGRDISLHDGASGLRLTLSNFNNIVVWNPGAADAAALSDLDDQEYKRFVCIEPAQIPLMTVAPGGNWTGAHKISSIP